MEKQFGSRLRQRMFGERHDKYRAVDGFTEECAKMIREAQLATNNDIEAISITWYF